MLVNRGWIPDKLKDPATRPAAQAATQATIECIVRPVSKVTCARTYMLRNSGNVLLAAAECLHRQ